MCPNYFCFVLTATNRPRFHRFVTRFYRLQSMRIQIKMCLQLNLSIQVLTQFHGDFLVSSIESYEFHRKIFLKRASEQS